MTESPQMPVAQIIATKFYVPPVRANAVARTALVEKLRAGVQRPGTFALISGPAGFGKTTLLSAFAAHCDRPLAWVSLDERDDDPAQFWLALLTACHSVDRSIGVEALDLLKTPQRMREATIPTLLVNDFAAHDGDVVLVLDDYHVIQHEAIHDGLLFLLEYSPPNLHLIISTRADPPWPLARFRARNRLLEVRARELRFTLDDAGEFLTHTMGLSLSPADTEALSTRTEGWVAGLQLAALSLQGKEDPAAFIRHFTGSHVYIAEYLLGEILQVQPDRVQRFLFQSSVLDRMSGPLCEAVTDVADGRALLTQLFRANVFLVPLDGEGRWFRYHHLFADLLRARLHQHLSAEEIRRVHLRASAWYEQNGFIPQAVQHALEAEDFERTAALVDRAGERMMFTDRYALLASWLAALPPAAFQAHPRLEIYRMLIELNLGTLDMYEATLREKESLVRALPASPENDRLRREALVYLSLFMAHQNTGRAIAMANEAQAEIPAENLKLRAFLSSALYRAHGMEGDYDSAARAYRECFELAQLAGQYGMLSNTTMVRAFDLCQYGRLEEAAHYCQQIVELGQALQRKVFYPAGTAYIGLGGIHLERFDLDAAERYLRQGLKLCQEGGTYGLYTGYLQLARLLQAQGDLDGAWREIRRLEQTLQRRDFTLTARQVSLRLAMGDIDGASRLVQPLMDIFQGTTYSRDLPLIAAEAFNLYLARIFIAQGDVGRAERRLDQIEKTVAPGRRYGRMLEVYLLRALAAQQRGALDPARRYLVRALDFGEPAGFVLLFVEEGPAIVPLLESITANRSIEARLRRYARTLLRAFQGEDLSGEAGAGLVEPLTPREMEVLQLLAAGDSNQMIADQLVITVRTVKKHISNILGKLEVSNRTQAAARARELNLLDD